MFHVYSHGGGGHLDCHGPEQVVAQVVSVSFLPVSDPVT